MRLRDITLIAGFLTLALIPSLSAEDKDSVLRKLDAASLRFHAAIADFEADAVQTDPIPDRDVQKGTVYFVRKGKDFQVAAHIREENGKPAPKVYGRFGGQFKLFDEKSNQLTISNNFGRYESYLRLGFGASGKELEEKWDIRYLGSDTLDNVKTEKLELIARDADVRKMFPKVIVWMDTDRGVSLKIHFDEGPGQYRDCFYFNIRMPQSLPAEAFTLHTNSQTTTVNR
jgi:hypothetical protein